MVWSKESTKITTSNSKPLELGAGDSNTLQSPGYSPYLSLMVRSLRNLAATIDISYNKTNAEMKLGPSKATSAEIAQYISAT